MNSSPKTLIIRFSSVGDIVLSSPLVRGVRRRFPQSQIDYVTRAEYAQLVKFNPNLNLTYEFDASKGFDGLRALKRVLRTEGYDLIIDIHNSLRSRFLRSIREVEQIVRFDKRIWERSVLVKFKKNLYKDVVSVADRYLEPLSKLGIEPDGKGLELHIPDEILFGVSSSIAKLRLARFEKVIGLCPTSRHFTKRWPAGSYARLGQLLVQRLNAKILIFGGPDEVYQTSEIAQAIESWAGPERATNFSGQTSLLETAAAMEYCDVLITNDSGLMHVAAAMKKNVVAIFGSTVREFGFFPVGTRSVVLERAGLYCRPCSHIGRASCPEGHLRCLTEIGEDEVYAAVVGMLDDN